MGNAKENLLLPPPSDSDLPNETQPVPVEQLDYTSSPPHHAPMDPSESGNLPSSAPNVNNNGDLKSSPQQQSHLQTPFSDNNRLDLKSSPQQSSQTQAVPVTNPQQLQTEAAAIGITSKLKTSNQKPQTETILDGNSTELKTNNQQPSDEDVEMKTSPQKPHPEASPNDHDVHLTSSPKKHRTEAASSDKGVGMKLGQHEPHQGSPSPAPLDEKKSLLKSETEPIREKIPKSNETSDCKSKTCDIDGTTISTGQLETAKPTADVKPETSEVPENNSGHHASIIPKEHNEPTTTHSGSSSIKTELENKRESKSAMNKTDIATPKSNGTSNSKNSFLLDDDDGNESGTEEEQWAFMKEIENFFRERSMEFKPPKFYGEGLNCLKLWRAVMKLGGYDKVTSCKLWRQVGESFKPPKTCTTVSWTFRGFYEKALLDYERHNTCGCEINVPLASNSEPMNVDNQVPGSGRARRDAAARAMQGWHSQRLLGNGEVSDPIIKDKNSISLQKHEKQLKSLGLLKRKKQSYMEHAVKAARAKTSKLQDKNSISLQKHEKQLKSLGLLKRKKQFYMEHAVKAARAKTSKLQLDVEVLDLGPPVDWVKINVQRTKDCFEVYALVPGLLREEVRVQSDPAGRLVISGEPEHPDNPWGVTPFRKVVTLPSRIDPHQTSAVVTLHGQLFVRVPFEPSD